ncbi:PhoPQ-activated protein PqaA family protein [Fervidobacterium sp.]
MKRRRILTFLLLFAIFISADCLALSLTAYLNNSGSPIYSVVSSSSSAVGGKFFLLNVKSQVWRGIEWNHKVGIYIPRRLVYKNHGIIMVTGSAPRDPISNLNQYAFVIESIGAPFVILWDIPNQPIFGLREDALIAYTLSKYIETGEEDWPLLFPMVKSVVSTMNCVQDFLKKELQLDVQKFLLTGGSKRGWTTYLTAAVDERVFAIVPVVYDNLNLPAQMKKQLEHYGTFSEQIKDYTKYSLTKMMAEASHDEIPDIVKAIDPYYYIAKLRMPKLIVVGTNDPYWVVDSSQLYFWDLPDTKFAYVMPNEVHNIGNQLEFFNTLRAFFILSVANKLPELSWQETENGIILETSEELEYAKGWFATSDTLDFRKALWKSVDLPVVKNNGKGIVHLEKPLTNKNVAILIEVRILKEDYSFSLTTIPKVFRASK